MEDEKRPSVGKFEELPNDEQVKFLEEVAELCKKSIPIYSFLINQIYEFKKDPLPPVGKVISSVTSEGQKIIYEKDENENNNSNT